MSPSRLLFNQEKKKKRDFFSHFISIRRDNNKLKKKGIDFYFGKKWENAKKNIESVGHTCKRCKKAVIIANFFERSKLRLNDHNRGGENPIQKKNLSWPFF